ncbi:TAT-variant-translocated molybdopterin oxidoreductase, partial [Chloroflexus sp.]|uniref:TAT-variant-translocated molybdopterin oxidoreductase n=1 Tax=Chloroflexus sp. TaxID=1904827 RepID=UPI00404AC352
MNLHPAAPEIEAVRAQLQQARGKQFWRSLDQLVDTPAFRELVAREFPQGASELADPVSRRTFLKLMGASLALAGLSGCTFAVKQPQEQVAPFARAPRDQIPGIPNYYATAVMLDGFALGVTVKSHEGRPTKIEGNPMHPPALVQPIRLRRPSCWHCTIPTGLRRCAVVVCSAPGRRSLVRLPRPCRCSV